MTHTHVFTVYITSPHDAELKAELEADDDDASRSRRQFRYKSVHYVQAFTFAYGCERSARLKPTVTQTTKSNLVLDSGLTNHLRLDSFQYQCRPFIYASLSFFLFKSFDYLHITSGWLVDQFCVLFWTLDFDWIICFGVRVIPSFLRTDFLNFLIFFFKLVLTIGISRPSPGKFFFVSKLFLQHFSPNFSHCLSLQMSDLGCARSLETNACFTQSKCQY